MNQLFRAELYQALSNEVIHIQKYFTYILWALKHLHVGDITNMKP